MSEHSQYCEECNYKCRFLSDWQRHIKTKKHLNNMQDTKKNNSEFLFKDFTKYDEKKTKQMPHYCDKCNKQFKTYNSLWCHQNKYKCKMNAHDECNMGFDISQNILLINAINSLLKDNYDFKQLLIDQNNKLIDVTSKYAASVASVASAAAANSISYNSNNTNCNNNNKFNINIFLNEKCKDAISLAEFVNNLQIDIEDLENTAKLGYVDGITQIFVNGLKKMDLYQRPIHCTDVKRETFYIKDHDKWKKDDEEKTNLKKAISEVSRKNIQQLEGWKKENPGFSTDSRVMETHVYIMQSVLGGNSIENEKNKYKIIKNLAKESVIDRNC